MKVSVLGAGAIGSMLGGLIKHHEPDAELVFVVRGDHGRVLAERGTVHLDGPWGRRTVRVTATADMAEIAGSQFVLVTVKSQDTDAAMQAAAPYLGDAIVISIQNGVNDEVLARYVAPQRLVMGMTATNMAILEPGSVSLQLGGATVVGPAPDGRNQASSDAASRFLGMTGLQIEQHPNVLGVRYNKMAINALGYASCMSASNFITEAVCHRPWRQAVGLPLVDECVAAFARAGITLAKIPGRPDVNSLRRFLSLLDAPVAGGLVQLGARWIYNRKPIVFSLYQDLLRGKQTEVDYINGHLAGLAERHGLAAPRNRLVMTMVHELEQRGAGSFFRRDEVIERFRGLNAVTVGDPRHAA